MNAINEATVETGTSGAQRGLNKAIAILDRVGMFSRWTNVIGIAALSSMILVTFVNVFLRYIFNRPIAGVEEVTEVIMICAIFFAVAHTHNTRSHISVDLVTNNLAPKSRLVLEFITTVLSAGIFGIICWRTLSYALFLFEDQRLHSKFLSIPSGPFGLVIFIGSTALFLLLVRDFLTIISESLKHKVSRWHWTIMIGVPVILAVFCYFWTQPDLWDISLPVVGIIGVVVSLVLFLSGMPVAYVLILVSFLFISHIRGSTTAFNMVGTEVYRNSSSYSWSVLPFFVTMGFICLFARFGEDLYKAAYKWIGHIRAGLSVATISACTGFAAIVGDSISSTATMGAVALPQMKEYGYDERLSAGSIVSGATLGPIIPPSVAFIIIGVLTGISIGDLFIAGIIPGIVIAGCYILTIYIWSRINPKIGPAGERSGWKARIISLRAGGPVLLLFLLVIGGIYQGIFTPTEGGAIGAVGALVIGLVLVRFSWMRIFETLQESGKVISMTFIILIGSIMFTRFAAWTNLSNTLQNSIMEMGLSPTLFMVLILAALLFLGCFIDLPPLLLIGIPLLYPVALSLGIDPIWFAVISVIVINLGALTPPVGINLFVLKGVDKQLPISKIYAGAWPFVVGSIVAVIILFVAPMLTTWLPRILR